MAESVSQANGSCFFHPSSDAAWEVKVLQSYPRGSTVLMYNSRPLIGVYLSQRNTRGVSSAVTPYLTLPNIHEASERTHLHHPHSVTSTFHYKVAGIVLIGESTDISGRFEDSSSSSWGTPALRDRSGRGREVSLRRQACLGCQGPAAGGRAQAYSPQARGGRRLCWIGSLGNGGLIGMLGSGKAAVLKCKIPFGPTSNRQGQKQNDG